MIRKVITTVIISLVTLNYIQAQDKFKRELSLGASFGTTFSKVSFAQTKVQQKIKREDAVSGKWATRAVSRSGGSRKKI